MRLSTTALALSLFFHFVCVAGETITIPMDYPTIQEGIDAADDFDIVLVQPGTYYERIDFLGKKITVKSTDGARTTVIDGDHYLGSVVTFANDETIKSVLDGFTLNNGYGTWHEQRACGGGIFCFNSYPWIKNNIIKNGTATRGAGIYCEGALPVISNNLIYGNLGSGLALRCSSPVIVNNTIVDNNANGEGVGISGFQSTPDIINTIIWNHDSYEISIYEGKPKVRYSNIGGGWTGEGNIDSSPLFLDILNDDYHIVSNSACRDAGTNQTQWLSDKDIDGEDRILNDTVDIGADEFSNPHGTPCTRLVPGEYPTIQQAIDVSFPLDTIIVGPGTYFENIDFKGRAVSLISSEGSENTVIDGRGSGTVIIFNNAEGPETVLQGFTIQNGKASYLPRMPGNNDYCGGGIYCFKSSPLIEKNIIRDNRSLGMGGAIFCYDSKTEIKSNLIEANHATDYAGGIYARMSDLSVAYNVIEDNVCYDTGGGLHVFETSLALKENIISGNMAESNGGISIDDYCTATISNNIITENLGNEGSAVQGISGGSPMSITHNLIEKNFSGGVFGHGMLHDNIIRQNEGCGACWSGRATHNLITDNVTSNGCPGLECNGKVERNIITHNTTSGSGAGGIQCASSTVDRNIIAFNSTEVNGGGILCKEDCVLTNNLIYSNSAGNMGGGIHVLGDASSSIHNLIAFNTSEHFGGGLSIGNSYTLTISNTIIWGNEAPAGNSLVLGYQKPTVTIQYSNVEGGEAGVEILKNGILNWGDGMIDSDPLFADPENHDYHLTYDSPCRDAGTNSIGAIRSDFEDDHRIMNDIADIGADEFATHLYCMGDFSPSGTIHGKFVGIPNTSPVGLFIGSGVLATPLQHAWGKFYLEAPWMLVPLGVAIPANGILEITTNLPATPAGPYEIPMQALIGFELSNLFEVEVE